MRIIKTSSTQITPEVGQIVNARQESSVNTYSCNYINGIVESGSNSNGEWVKYADGTMICSFTQKNININVNSAWGSLYTKAFNLHDYPQKFINIPNATATLLTNDGSGNKWGGWLGIGGNSSDINPSSTNIGTLTILRPTSANGYFNINVIAIGRWK